MRFRMNEVKLAGLRLSKCLLLRTDNNQLAKLHQGRLRKKIKVEKFPHLNSFDSKKIKV